MGVTHLALDLGARHERGNRVDDDDVDRAGADQRVGDLERLLAGVGLRHQQRVAVDAELARVLRVEGVLGVDEGRDATGPLSVGDRVQRERRLAAGLRPVDLHDAAARQAADAERDVEGDRTGRDHLDRRPHLITEAHHRALAVRALDLRERVVEGLVAVGCCHGLPSRSVVGGCGRELSKLGCVTRCRRRR